MLVPAPSLRGGVEAARSVGRLPIAPALSGFGSVLKYARDPLRRFEDARALSERATAFRIFGVSYLLLFEPEGIEQVLVTRHAEFQKNQFVRDLRRVLGMGLLTSEGEGWRRNRKLAAPSFQRQEIAAYAPTMARCAVELEQQLPRGISFDVHSAMMRLTLDVLVRALFGARISRAAEVEELLERMMRDYLPIAEALRSALPEWFPVPSRRRLARLRRELDGILLELIELRKASLAAPAHGGGTTAGEPAPPDSKREDLLTRLMRAQDEAGGLSDAALRDEAMTIFLAGHETTALTLTYALWLLALHPEPRLKLHAEIDRVLGGREPSFDDLPALSYARAVVDEALRLYPPAWIMGRQPHRDLELSGMEVPRGTQVLVAPWITQRDARFFPHPERFWPERWQGEPPARWSYFPFGAGPRVCIGQHFAVAEAVLLLVTLAQRAQFSLAAGAELRLMPAVTLRPAAPVMMRCEPR